MLGFLDIVVDRVIAQYETNLQDYTFVLPGKRACLLFREKLLSKVHHTCWEPKFISLTELATTISQLEIANDIVLIARLYAICKEKIGQEFHDNFDSFFSWGEILLEDFAGIDNYMVDADKLIENLQNLKEIDEKFKDEDIDTSTEKILGTFVTTKQSYQNEFNKIWRKLPEIYHAYKSSLIADGIGYSGMINREAANSKALPNGKYIFIGFNTFNKAEQQLIKRLKPVHIYWDEIDFYDSSDINKAFNPDDSTLKGLGCSQEESIRPDKLSSRNIEIIKCPSDFSQCKVVMDKLGKLDNINNDTAVVLADDSLMSIMLQSIPNSVQNVNITTGLPITNSSAFVFYKILEDIAINQKNGLFSQKHIKNIINHPILKRLWTDDSKIIDLNGKTGDNIYQYIDISDIENQSFRTIFQNSTSSDFVIGKYFLDCLSIYSMSANSPETTEIILRMCKSIEILSLIIKRYNIEISNKIFVRILNRCFSRDYTPYETDAFEGLQITGILETRCQDFRTVFLLSANDDKLPKKNQLLSFIPMDIREACGLPTSGDFQRMSASYFYHIISRAENVYILYNCDTSGERTGEQSRFVHQLEFFKPENTHITKTAVTTKLKIKELNSLDICHSKETSQKILSRSLSASAINTYLKCQRKYALKYIADIPEYDAATKSFKAKDIGKATHKILEEICKKGYNKQKAAYLLSNFETAVVPTIQEHGIQMLINEYPHLEDSTDLNRVSQTIQIWIKNVLKYDSEHEEFQTIGVEKQISHSLNLPDGKEVKFKMIIDRMDEIIYSGEKIIRIVDYKTGKKENLRLPSALATIFGENKRNDYDHLLQTILYCLPFTKAVTAVYSLPIMNSNGYSPYINEVIDSINDSILTEFRNALENTISEIISSDPDKTFKARNANPSKFDDCFSCEFKNICGR